MRAQTTLAFRCLRAECVCLGVCNVGVETDHLHELLLIKLNISKKHIAKTVETVGTSCTFEHKFGKCEGNWFEMASHSNIQSFERRHKVWGKKQAVQKSANEDMLSMYTHRPLH